MKKIFFILSIFACINYNNAYANLDSFSCENPLTKNKAFIVYGNNFAKEEMSPNIWLFFQKIKLNNNNLNLISMDDDKPIREWKINLTSGEAILTPMFDSSSNWLCRNKDKQLKMLIDLYKNESDKNIWSLVSGIFATLHKIDSSNELENYIAQFCKPLLDKLGSEYIEGIDQEMSQLKSLICFLYAKYSKDDKFVSHFTNQFNSEKYKDYSDGNYYNLVLSISGLDKSISINNYLNNFINSDSPQIEARFRSSLPGVNDPETPKVVIEAILNETIRGADAPYLLAGLISHHENGKNAWEIIKSNWENLLKVMPEWTSSRILDGLPSIYDENLGNDIQDFIKLNPLPSAEKIMKQKFERLNANIKFKNSINSVLKKAKFV